MVLGDGPRGTHSGARASFLADPATFSGPMIMGAIGATQAICAIILEDQRSIKVLLFKKKSSLKFPLRTRREAAC